MLENGCDRPGEVPVMHDYEEINRASVLLGDNAKVKSYS